MQPRVVWGLAFGILPYVLSFGLLANVGLNLAIGLHTFDGIDFFDLGAALVAIPLGLSLVVKPQRYLMVEEPARVARLLGLLVLMLGLVNLIRVLYAVAAY